jgi:hypothetical protein
MLRLKQGIISKGMTVKGCAELLGISERALYNKLIGDSDFTYREYQKLSMLFPDFNMEYYLTDECPPCV